MPFLEEQENDRLSEQRCPICQCVQPVSVFVQVPGIGQICDYCDDELLAREQHEREQVEG